MTLALFVLEPIGANSTLEAVDVLYFCSEECRQIIVEHAGKYYIKVKSDVAYFSRIAREAGFQL